MKRINLRAYLNIEDILNFDDDVTNEEIEAAIENEIYNNLQIDWEILDEDEE